VTMLPKPVRVRLTQDEYAELRRQVLDRDGWKCRVCGNRKELTVDHIKKRSQGGGDTLQNLWVLCNFCHRQKDFYGHPI
jgi:5-methylcytosine-specific restriction endonuclease McrA